ncbi:MAG: hypothetical protein IJI66_01965 [Erysipelotrichaceae bacterium]|nr:hypothetical protein [Erysipelotrichaceae bacterium]
MEKNVAEKFGLTEISDQEYAYLNPEIDKEDFVRIVLEYEVLLRKYNDLEKKYESLLNNTKSSFARMKSDIDQLKVSVYQNSGEYYV